MIGGPAYPDLGARPGATPLLDDRRQRAVADRPIAGFGQCFEDL